MPIRSESGHDRVGVRLAGDMDHLAAKTIELRRKTAIATRGLGLLERDTALADAERASRDGSDAVAQIIRSAAREASLSGGIFDDGFKERIALRLDSCRAAMSRQMRAAPAFWRRSAPPHRCRLVSERCGGI